MLIKLNKAIEILDLCLRGHALDDLPDFPAAFRLSIEGLKEIKRARDNGYRFVAVRLPGEEPEE